MDSVLFILLVPAPLHILQGFEIVFPSHPQSGHVCCKVKNPCCALTWPCPSQVSQVLGLDPVAAPLPLQSEHFSEVGTLKVCFLP